MVNQYCAECGNRMHRRDGGAWVRCCNGLGYWADVVPKYQDWRLLGYEGPGAMEHYHPDDESKPLFFYPTANWPNDRRPATPIEA